MEFTNYTCPVCSNRFKAGDDVVVCPECGAPHHRSCYEISDRCFFHERHAEGFSYEALLEKKEEQKKEQRQGFEDLETVVCPVCFLKNPVGRRNCARCGSDLSMEDPEQNRIRQEAQQNQQQNQQPNQQPVNGMPFAFGGTEFPGFDPLAGLDSKEPVGDNVTAGEAAKFTGKNTPYFSMLFSRLRKFNRSKFSFAAFIFSGVYFLYRKMYGIGILFVMIQIVTNVLSTFIMMTSAWQSCVSELTNMTSADIAGAQGIASALLKLMFIYLPFVLSGSRYVLMLISGLTANRKYYNHTIKKINQIKNDNKGISADELNKKLEEGGGVNLPIALSFGISILVINYICNFFLMSVL